MWYKHHLNKLTINVYIQPGAKATELLGLYNNALKIRLNAPPIQGRANDALQKYIAQLFKVPLKQVALVQGKQSKRKTLIVEDTTVDPELLLKDDKR